MSCLFLEKKFPPKMYSVIQLKEEMQISSCCVTEIFQVPELLFSEVFKSVSVFLEQYHDSSKSS